MEKYNFSKYFDKKGQKYYDPKIMITILSDILGKNIDELKRDLANFKITVTKEQIIDFLTKKFAEEYPEVKARLEARPSFIRKSYIEETKEERQRSEDEIVLLRYTFTPSSLQYFFSYSNIVRKKAKSILDIIEGIANKDYSAIAKLLNELDIVLDENDNILKTDIVRLVLPFVYCYTTLEETIKKANNLETYKDISLFTTSLAGTSIVKRELYPIESLQGSGIVPVSDKSCIPFSSKQKKLKREAMKKNITVCIERIFY